MDIQQYIFNYTGVLLPISGGNGQSQDQAIVIGSEAKYRLIQVENEFISAMLDEGYWKKVEQSLIIEDGKKYDKILVKNYMDDDAVERVFWNLIKKWVAFIPPIFKYNFSTCIVQKISHSASLSNLLLY